MLKRKSLLYVLVLGALLTGAAFGAFTIGSPSRVAAATPVATATPESATPQSFDPAQMAETMTAMLDQMQAMMAAAPDDAARQQMAPAMMSMLKGMMDLNQTMMGQMESMSAPERQALAPQMMAGMSRMTDMMGQMQSMMGGGAMGPGMMGGTAPMTGTMPMGPQAGGPQMMGPMMGMMGQMMQMMGQMQSMMGGGAIGQTAPATPAQPGPGMMGPGGSGMMGGNAMTPSEKPGPSAETPGPGTRGKAPLAPQTAEAGGVVVEVAPLNLNDENATSLDFRVALNTHSVELDKNLAQIAILRVDDQEIPASGWQGPVGGHHVSGVLSFPATDESGQPLLQGASTVSLVIKGLGGVAERTFTWQLGR